MISTPPPPPPVSSAGAKIHALAISPTHAFSKTPQTQVTLLAGLGIQGDCHCGVDVQHRSRMHLVPRPKNLRQVHLIAREFLEELAVAKGEGADGDEEGRGRGVKIHGFVVKPGELGENITTEGLDLLGLRKGTRLLFVPHPSTSSSSSLPSSPSDLSTPPYPTIIITGLRNPCPQIDHFQRGLRERCLARDAQRVVVARKAGIMAVVERGGVVRVGDRVEVVEPEEGEEEGVGALVCV